MIRGAEHGTKPNYPVSEKKRRLSLMTRVAQRIFGQERRLALRLKGIRDKAGI